MVEIIDRIKIEIINSWIKQIKELTENKTRLENSIRVNTKIIKEIKIKMAILTKFKDSIEVI